jgi:hypothetical protein
VDGRTCALVVVTLAIVAILYRRRLIQRDAAGIATATPTIKREAVKSEFNRLYDPKHGLTDVTPHRSVVDSRRSPYNRIDGQIEKTECRPDHIKTSSRVERLKMPWKGNKQEAGAEEA